jgi:protein-S-isoprenylcysteine O-methyltransferase Ste14
LNAATSKGAKLRIVLSWLVLVLLLAVIAVSRSLWAQRPTFVGSALFAGGMFLVGIATVGRLWCSAYIGGYKENALVTAGPYSMSRNPLYFFSLLGVVGVGLTTETVLVPVLGALVFALYYPPRMDAEEALLSARHGDAYAEYCRCTPRFLPRLSLLREPAEYRLNTIVFRKHLLDALWFVWFVGVLGIVTGLQRSGALPVWFHVY